MKKITEMTELEILELTNNDLDMMVKIRMAEDGIKIILMPDKPSLIPIPDPDMQIYSIGGVSVRFTDIAVAQQVSSILIANKAIACTEGYEGDYNRKFIKPVTAYPQEYGHTNYGKVEIMHMYSRELFSTISETIKSNVAINKEHEALSKEYNEAHDQAQYIRDEIFDRYNEVVNKHHKMKEMKMRYTEYMVLANNNEDIALQFLKKAYSINDEMEQYITGKVHESA